MAYGSGLYGAGPYGSAGGISVLVDWNKDGDYTDTYDDVTDLVRRTAGISVEYGRDQSTALAPTVAGRGSVTLDNTDKRFSPRNTSSVLYGLIKPARPVLIKRDTGTDVYALFIGHTDDSPINPNLDNKTVTLSMVDTLADFKAQTISTPLYRSIRTGQAIGYVLDAIGWSGTARDLDAGATVIPWWWEEGTDALSALEKIVRAEGPPAMLTIGAAGSIVFKDRHHRLTDTASLTSQSTWRATGTVEPVMLREGFSYDEAWRNIINTGSAAVDVRTPGEVEAVFTSDATLSFTSGEVKLITANASNPFYDAIVPVSGTDFTVLSGTVSAALTRTSGGSTTIILTSTGASVIQGLQLRANPVPVAYSIQVSVEDGASVGDYGVRSFGDLPWVGPYDADAVLSTAVALRSQPVPILQCRFQISSLIPGKADLILARDLSDRVTIVESETSTNGDFYVENIAHDFTSEYDHVVTFGVEAVPATNPLVQFRFDTTGAGFNDGYFYTGVDTPSTMFRFDSSATGHMFDSGLFAT